MKIPRSVVINGKRWRVVRCQMRRNLYGKCDYRKREIRIETELPRVEAEETYLHEVFHACLGERWTHQIDEPLNERLAARFLHTLKGMR